MELCRRVTAQSKSVDVVGGWCRASVVQLYRRAGAALQQIYKPGIGDSTSSAQWSKSGRGATAPCIQLEADDRRCCYLAILHVHLIQTLIGGAGGCTRERSRFQCQRGLVDGQLAEAWTLGGMRGRRTSAPTRGEIAVYSLQPPTCTTNGWLSSLSLSLSLSLSFFACAQRWSQIERSSWLQQKRDVAEEKLKQKRNAIRRREPFLPISSARTLPDFKPRISGESVAHPLPQNASESAPRLVGFALEALISIYVGALYHFTVRAAPVESRKSTGSTQSEARGTADWDDGWDEDGAH